jgi:hypothetical protein
MIKINIVKTTKTLTHVIAILTFRQNILSVLICNTSFSHHCLCMLFSYFIGVTEDIIKLSFIEVVYLNY